MATNTKTIERKLGKMFIRVTAELREDDPNGLSDGFAITGELYEPHGTWDGRARYRNGRDADVSGTIHDEILRYAPDLKPLVDVHLADPDGTPMHAVANGWYFYTGQGREYELKTYGADYVGRGADRERAARALHITVAELPEGLNKEQFEAFAESLRGHWAAQAQAARELLERL